MEKPAIIVINLANSINFLNTIPIIVREQDARNIVFYAINFALRKSMITMIMPRWCMLGIRKQSNSDFKKNIYAKILIHAKKSVPHKVYVLLVINKRNNFGRKAINKHHTST